MSESIRDGLTEVWEFIKVAAEPTYLALIASIVLGSVFGVGMLLFTMMARSCGSGWSLF